MIGECFCQTYFSYVEKYHQNKDSFNSDRYNGIYCASSRILPTLAFFLAFLRDFLDSLHAVYLLISLVAQSIYIHLIFT